MKDLKDIIIERLHINKNTGEDIEPHLSLEKFCRLLYLNNTKNTEELYDFYINDCDNIIIKNFDGGLLSTNFELMFMLAAMIIDDGFIPTVISKIGTKSYQGDNNPYDFSWFEVEDSNENTVLEIMGKLYESDKEFSKIFRLIYNIIDIECISTKKAIDGIWDLQNHLE